MHGIKYILFLFLCEGGCVLRTFGIGPGLVSISPQRRSRSLSMDVCVVYRVGGIVFVGSWFVFIDFFGWMRGFLSIIVLVLEFVVFCGVCYMGFRCCVCYCVFIFFVW